MEGSAFKHNLSLSTKNHQYQDKQESDRSSSRRKLKIKSALDIFNGTISEKKTNLDLQSLVSDIEIPVQKAKFTMSKKSINLKS